jgi:hypothetical protein
MGALQTRSSSANLTITAFSNLVADYSTASEDDTESLFELQIAIYGMDGPHSISIYIYIYVMQS